MTRTERYERDRLLRHTPRKRAEFSSGERQVILELIREAEQKADPAYVLEATRFWLTRQAPPELRSFS